MEMSEMDELDLEVEQADIIREKIGLCVWEIWGVPLGRVQPRLQMDQNHQ